MAFYDLREYLQKLEECGELSRIDAEVDADLEVGAITQRIAEKGGRAAHFLNVKGASNDATLVGGSMNRGSKYLWAKVAIAFDCEPDIHYRDLLDKVIRRLEAPIKPLQVKSGLCKDNVVLGDAVDLDSILAPRLHEGDAGRYLSSWGFTVAKEPGSGHIVWDVLPQMVHSPNTLVGDLPSDSAVGKLFRDSYEVNNEPMPFAIVIGAVPTATAAAAFRLRRGGSAVTDLAGGLQQTPIQLVKCETNDLLVPANAELVLEGVVRPGERVEVNAFPSAFGYRKPTKTSCAVLEVQAVCHRSAPILPFSTWGIPVSEIHLARSLDSDTQINMEFIKRGAPARDVYTPPWLAGSVIAISTKMPYTAYAQSIAGLARATEAGKDVPFVLVCDDDIDVTQPVPLFHALVTKCHPSRDTWKTGRALASPDAVYLDASERALKQGASMIFDCSWPLDWDRSIAVPPRVSFDQCYPEALQQQVLEEWTNALGFPSEGDRPAVTL